MPYKTFLHPTEKYYIKDNRLICEMKRRRGRHIWQEQLGGAEQSRISGRTEGILNCRTMTSTWSGFLGWYWLSWYHFRNKFQNVLPQNKACLLLIAILWFKSTLKSYDYLKFLFAVEGKVHFGKDKTLATIYQLFIGVQGDSFLPKILLAFHWMH